MSSQASATDHGEAEVRRKLVETGDIDVMISIRSDFFYTRTVPRERCPFDKGKPADRRDQVLMRIKEEAHQERFALDVRRKAIEIERRKLYDKTADVESVKAVCAAADAAAKAYEQAGATSRMTTNGPGFWLDRYPVTRGQFARFLKATGYSIMTNGWVVGSGRSLAPDQPGMEHLPMIGVNAADAEAYARWMGKRLPTEAEWELAARGTDGRLYPWSHAFSSNVCLKTVSPFFSSQECSIP